MQTTEINLVSSIDSIKEFPLSEIQRKAWFLYNLEPQSCIDKIAFAIHWRQQVDVECLQQAFEKLIERHLSLHTAYIDKQGKLVQQVLTTITAEINFVDASNWSEDKLEEKILDYSQYSFDLAVGSVVRMSLFSRTPTNHVLLLVVHCIACDQWGLLLLLDELLTLYHQLKSNTVISLSSLSSSYQDYVQQEINLLNSPEGKQLRHYWQQCLTGELSTLELPSARSRSPLRSYKGACYKFSISPEITDKIKYLAITEDVELSTVVLTAFQIMLHRYTAMEDILVGLLPQRYQSEFKNLVGNFANLAVVRTPISGDVSFQQYLSQVKFAVAETISHQAYPFPLLVRQLQLSQLSYPPICQVGFAYHYLHELKIISKLFDENNRELEYFEIPQQRTEFDLSLEILESQESLICFLHYNSDLLDVDTIARAGEHLQNLLVAIIANPQESVARLPLLSDREKHQLLVEWNSTVRDYDLSRCLHELFEAQVEKTPEAIALTFEEEQLTYRELNCRANQLAHYLQNFGVKPEVLVGICVERSVEMVVGLLGILKAGGAYVPIDPEYPPERLAYMLADSQVSVLLTQQKLLARLPNHQAQIICLDQDWQKISQKQNTNPISNVKPDNFAYVIYTSGSTGKPKGAMNTHRGICNRLLWMQEAYQLTSTDRVLQKTPFSFDVSVWEFFWTLLNGARLVVAKPGGHRDSTYLVKLIIQEQITTIHFVPSMLQVFLDSRDVKQCSSLKRVICSGEALPLDLQARFFQCLQCELHNLYGPTEAAIDVTAWQCQKESNLRTIPIGRPVANTQIYILDSHLQPVPIGVVGELHIGGVQVARGYLNRPDLTQEKFIANPFGKAQENCLYKTGDLARYLSDGNIEYIGRSDYQVKIRGLRIELGEIENALSHHCHVREVVVIVRCDRPGDQQLVAYITTEQEKPTPESLREFLKQKLPDYMVPVAFVILEVLPLTPSGKLDRRALPKPNLFSFSQNQGSVLPRNDTERELAKIWLDILNIQSVGVRDNFFEIGGTSLSAIYLIAAIEQQFGKELPLSMLLTNPTIEQLAKVLHLSSEQTNSSLLIPIQPKGNKQPFFCVHPAGGHVLCYFNLARYLGTDQPFYGLQAQGFNDDEEPLTRVEDMASTYVEAIRKFQPYGPYQIGGWSFGGIVAYEIAQQLHKQGQEVSLLAILDSYLPIILDPNKKIDNKYLVGVLSRVFGGMFGQDNLVTPQEIQHLSVDERLDYIIEKARKAKIFPPGVERSKNRRILDVLVGTLKATYSYVRQPYPGKVTIFRASEKHIMAPDPTLVWVELLSVMAAKDIKVVNVPGNHYTFILEPHVKALAERLKSYLSSSSQNLESDSVFL
ncbi:amino acid adenylation domain-containing protein [Chlorogloeopsis sp. ULAP02]|uniref:amino acid adenylation domain-containing protein n=1 Tax=Chlorogloeopsis sp. ULAP02 TaxID=3107926 RepID=UPI003134D5E2